MSLKIGSLNPLDYVKRLVGGRPSTSTTPVDPQDLFNAKISAQLAPLMAMFAMPQMAGNTPQYAQGVQQGMEKGAATGAQGSPQLYEAMMKSLSGQANPKSNYDIANMFYGTQAHSPTPELKSGGGPSGMDILNTLTKTFDVFDKLKKQYQPSYDRPPDVNYTGPSGLQGEPW